MWTAVLLIAVSLLAGGCSLLEFDKAVVRSELFPDVSIECRGEVVLRGEACRAWGEKLIAGAPGSPGQTVRLVLTYRTGNTRCAADFFDASGQLFATAATICPRP